MYLKREMLLKSRMINTTSNFVMAIQKLKIPDIQALKKAHNFVDFISHDVLNGSLTNIAIKPQQQLQTNNSSKRNTLHFLVPNLTTNIQQILIYTFLVRYILI